MNSPQERVLETRGLRVEVRGHPIVQDINLHVATGEIVGVVGESGSGKTTMATALLGYASRGATITAGEVVIDGHRLRAGSADSRSAVRGRLIAYVPQNPGLSLNPALRIARSIEDVIRACQPQGRSTTAEQVLGAVHLPADRQFARRYPHQLSGGQQQRVCIGMAISGQPRVVVLDEPTTGLDVVTQERIVEELRRLRERLGTAMLYVTHDLALISNLADRLIVMYAGRIVEEGSASELIRSAHHPYTRGLLRSIPDHRQFRIPDPMTGISVGVDERPAGCAFAPRCPLRVARCEAAVPPVEPTDHGLVRCFRWRETDPPQIEVARARPPVSPDRSSLILSVEELCATHRTRSGDLVVADGVSFAVHRGRCVALVGESGSGKTTVARVIAGLHPLAGGRLALFGAALAPAIGRRNQTARRALQMIAQNPADALNPRLTVAQQIARPLKLFRGLSGQSRDQEIAQLLDHVLLPRRTGERYPHELSGGERQRAAIARALAAGPDLLICDEVTSALDVSVQAGVLRVLERLRLELGLGLLFITHDIGVVAALAAEVLVLRHGKIVESGPTADVLTDPRHEYTRTLLHAAPSLIEAA